jgi:hypothetical protein
MRRSSTHQYWPSSPPKAATRFKGESSQQGRRFAPLWAPSSSPPRLIYDDNGVMWVPYQQSFYPGRGGSRRPVLDQISRPTRDRWTPRQSGQGHQDHPVGPPPIGGQTALRRKVQLSPKQVYKPKIREEKVEEMDVDPERTTSQDIIHIGTMDVPVEKDSKRPVVLNNQVGTSAQKGSIATSDHEASGTFYRDGVLLV